MCTGTYKNIRFQIKHYILCRHTNALCSFLKSIWLSSYRSNRNLKIEYTTIVGRCDIKTNNICNIPIILLIWHCLPMRKRSKRWL